MSARSRQAQALARDLSGAAGVSVRIEYTGPGRWDVQWVHGPTSGQMQDLARVLLATGGYPDMAGQRLGWYRGWAPRAWAARAAAAHRDGSLHRAVDEGAAWRRQHSAGIRTDLTPEDFAMLAYIEELIEATPDPDRASDPADEPVIERLLAASGGSEYRMTALLLAADAHILTGELPPGVTPLHRPNLSGPTAPAGIPGRAPPHAPLLEFSTG